MTRPVLALALASFSHVVLGAGPPVTEPVDVEVVNSVLSVKVSNGDADAIPVSVASAQPTAMSNVVAITGGGSGNTSGATSYTVTDATFRLTGFTFQLGARSNSDPNASCIGFVQVYDEANVPVATLYILTANQGESLVSPFVPLPNMAVPVGYKVRARFASNDGALCTYSAAIMGLIGG